MSLLSIIVAVCAAVFCTGVCAVLFWLCRRQMAFEKETSRAIKLLDQKCMKLGKAIQTLLETAGKRELESLGAKSAEGGLFADQIASLREAAGKADPANDEEMAIAAKLLSTADDLEGLSTTLSTTLSGLCGGS